MRSTALHRPSPASAPRRGRFPALPFRLLVSLGAVFSLLAAALVTAAPASAGPAAAGPTAAPAAGSGYGRSISPTPYMGWNTYYAIGTNYNETTIKAAADQLSTMRNLGYKYVWLDGGWWQGQRNPDGSIKVDSTLGMQAVAQWPDGMQAVADYIHSKGLKAGIYTDIGSDGCGGTGQGSLGHYQQDANTFAAWGYDAVKVDWCGGNDLNWTEQDAQTHYTEFSQALANNSSHRPMLYNICIALDNINQGQYSWAPQVANSYRVSGDEGSTNNVSWTAVLDDLDQAAAHPEATGPGFYADPDYVNVGVPNLSTAEGQSQMSMWSMLSAPLILGTDIVNMSPATKTIVSNPDVIAVDQDPAVAMATKVAEPSPGLQVWSKQLTTASGQAPQRAVALLNRTGAGAIISTTAAAVGLPPANAYVLHDIWQHSDTETAGRISAYVPAHGTVLYRAKPAADPAGYPPATTLSSTSSTAPVYGGQSIPVTTTFENDGRTLVTNLAYTFSGPPGWQVQPTSASGGTVGTNGQQATAWTVTPPAGTLPGTYALTSDATYRWGGYHTVRATSRTEVTVLTASPGTAPATVTMVNPPQGANAGGTNVDITGTGFTNVTSVTFGNVPAQNFVVTSPTTITAVSPSEAAAGNATVDVVVTDGNGNTRPSPPNHDHGGGHRDLH